jgi:general secretion pathway protein B
MDKCISITDVQPGMVIVRVTQQNGAIKIKKSGLVSSPEMITGLAEMGVQEVEIDPSQTVEIDVPGDVVVPRQAPVRLSTRQLLESGTGFGHKADHVMSEQFNRNLFLPSVQDIPSLWQYHSKRFAAAALMVCGGLAIGWTGATYQQWLLIFAPQTEQVARNLVPLKGLPVETLAPGVSGNAQPILANVPVAQVAQQAEKTTQELATAKLDTAGSERQTASAPPELPVNVKEAEVQSTISPALLKRFEEAINQLDDGSEAQYQVPIPTASDVPRIDQLPARLMTQLPAMVFSAHMYASNAGERWVRVNGSRMVEGDIIDGKVRIMRIEPQRLILNYREQDFSMAALTDW